MVKEKYREVEGNRYERLDESPLILKCGANRGIVYGPFADGEIVVYSDRGIVRTNNEDSFGINPQARSLVVPDGMGGAEYGAEAAEEVSRAVTRAPKNGFLRAKEQYNLATRILEANGNMKERARTKLADLPVNRLPGAAVGAVYIEENGILKPYHAGDVRVYVFDEQGDLRYMTRDHTAVQEALEIGLTRNETDFKERNIILRVIGHLIKPQDLDSEIVEVNSRMREGGLSERGRLLTRAPTVQGVQLHPNWRFLVASDGLHEYMRHDYICDRVKSGRSPIEIVEDLIDKANTECGGQDNITIAYGVYQPSRTAPITKKHEIAEEKTPVTAEIPILGKIIGDSLDAGEDEIGESNRVRLHKILKSQNPSGFYASH